MSETYTEVIFPAVNGGEFRRAPDKILYPGYRGGNGFTHNLSTYREGVRWFIQGEAEKDHIFGFDIERHVSWDNRTYSLYPMQYSAMISCKYPAPSEIRKRLNLSCGLTQEEFDQLVAELSGFVLDKQITLERNGQHRYLNLETGILVDWIPEPLHGRRRFFRTDFVTIGVIQKRNSDTLDILINRDVPYIVDTFNRLSPTKKLTPEIVARCVELAREADKVVPQKRTK